MNRNIRFSVLLCSLLIGAQLVAQTDEKEKQTLSLLFSKGTITNYEFSKMSKKWVETIDTHPFPVLPVDSAGIIQYTYLLEFKNTNREKLFHRTLEWLTIRYGIIPSYLYSNIADGKIICSNSTKITSNTSGVYTYIFTIKDNKLRIEFANIGHEVKTGGFYSGEHWQPEVVSFVPFQDVFPIVLKDPSEWDYYLKIATSINSHAEAEVKSILEYISNYDIVYDF